MVAQAKVIDKWERFTLVALPDKKVALLFHTGFLLAKNEGGGRVLADAPWTKKWESWELIRNDDGTVSLKSDNGHYFVAKDGGGSFCAATSPKIDSWEKFHLEFLDGGRACLKTQSKGLYVTAGP